jgi:GAF domain-containing protein
MKRRSRAGGETSKGPGRKTPQPKRRNAPKTRPNASHSEKETEVVRLARELNEALERQSATSEVLNVISSSSGELDPAFNAILQNSARICQAQFGTLNLYDGTAYRPVALHNAPQNFARTRLGETFRPHPDSGLAYVARNKKVFQIDDIRTRQPYIEGDKKVVELADIAGARTVIIVPMLNKEKLVGTISIYRQEVRPFTDKQIELVKSFAAQAVIAIENARLLNELRQRTTDLTESLDRQTATSEVLRVISTSPGDMKPVFEAILANALRICEAKFGHILLYDGECYHAAHLHDVPPSYRQFWEQHGPLRPGPNTGLAQLARTKQITHIPDLKADPTYAAREPLRVITVDEAGARTFLGVPMVTENKLVGAVVIIAKRCNHSRINKLSLLRTSPLKR